MWKRQFAAGSPDNKLAEVQASGASSNNSKDILSALNDEETRLRLKLMSVTGDLEEMAQSRENAELDNIRQLQQQAADLELEDRKLVATVEHHRRSISSTQRSIQSLEGDLATSRRRLATLRNEMNVDPSAAAAQNNDDNKTGPTTGSPKGKESDADEPDVDSADYTQLVHQVERAEARVIALRQHHVRSRDEARAMGSDVAECRIQADQQSEVLLELHRLHAEHANLQASAHTKEAQHIVSTHAELQKQLVLKQQLIEELHTEKATMLRHLLTGATERHDTLRELRSRFLTLGGGAAAGGAGNASAFQEVFEDNQAQRHNLVNVYFSMDAEMEALQQYIQVLSTRCEESSDRIHNLTFEMQLTRQVRGDVALVK